jgi:hypothetical protein
VEAPGESAGPMGPLAPVRADQARIWIGERGERVVRENLADVRVGAWLEGNGGEWQFVAGRGDAQGHAEVPVPPGKFVLQVGTLYIVSSTVRAFDLTDLWFGAPERLPPAARPAPISLSLSGLHPWQQGDRLLFHVPALSELEAFAHEKLMPAPAPGATSLVARGDLASFAGAALIDGPVRGDEVWIAHQGVGSAAGARYLTPRSVWHSREVKTVAGQATTITAAMTAVPTTSSLAIEWPAAEYQAIIAESSPRAGKVRGQIEVLAAPAAERFGAYEWSGNLLVAPVADTPVTFEAAIGDPFPPSWGRVARVRAYFDSPAQPPGRPAGILTGWITTTDTVGALTAGPLRPLVTPARDLRINGRPAYTDLSGTTTTPRFTWSPPATGTPGLYRARIYRVEPTEPRWREIASFLTTETSLTLPPEVLQSGQSYALLLDARVGEGQQLATPFRFGTRTGRAMVWTAVFQP